MQRFNDPSFSSDKSKISRHIARKDKVMDLNMMVRLVKTFLCTGNDRWLDQEVDSRSEASFYSRVRASRVFSTIKFYQDYPLFLFLMLSSFRSLIISKTILIVPYCESMLVSVVQVSNGRRLR